MHESAAWVLLESAMADLPADLRWLFESGAVTIEQLAALHLALGATSVGDLGAAVADRAVQAVAGLNESIELAIAGALPDLRRTVPRIPLGRAVMLAGPILERLRSVAGVAWASPGGSLRRGQDTVGDIEIMAATRSRRRRSPSSSNCRTSCAVSIAATAACTCCSSACRSAYACRIRVMQARR